MQFKKKNYAFNKRKKYLELQKGIAKAEAEERAYAEAEQQNEFHVVGETYEHTHNLPNPGAISGQNLNDTQNTTVATATKVDRTQLVPASSQNPSHQVETPTSRPETSNANTPELNYAQFSAARSDNQVLDRVLVSQLPRTSELCLRKTPRTATTTLPQPDLPIFDGDPTRYCDFIRAFQNLIERKTKSPSERLYYLVQYTSGQVNELMSSCLSMQDTLGYDEARKLLLERYGQPFKIATAFVDRLTNGSQIKAEDGPGLQRFSTLLTSCKNTLKGIGYLNKLENPDSMRKIVDRLPFRLRIKWRESVDNLMQKEERDANLQDIAKFVESRARVANHPIFGKVTSDAKRADPPSNKRPSYPKGGNHAYAADGKEISCRCPSCSANHWLSQCNAFKKMNVDQRYKFVRMKKLCINCLTPGHFVRNCSKRSFCRVQDCSVKHSTFLHLKDSGN